MDEIWWLVARNHPDKNFINNKNFLDRVKETKKIIDNSKIKVIVNKKFTGNISSFINIERITKTYKKKNFVWLMGADNLYNFHTWYNWKEIFNLLPIAIFNRPGYSNTSLASKTAKKFGKNRSRETFSRKLSNATPPAWIFFHGQLNYLESKILRKKNEK